MMGVLQGFIVVQKLCDIVPFANDTTLVFKVERRNPSNDEVNGTLSLYQFDVNN